MRLKNRNKISAKFEMASLTDIVFLLLIFFMLTSTFVAPNAIKLILPSATGQTMATQTVTLSVNDKLEYFVNGQRTPQAQLRSALSRATAGIAEPVPTVVLRVDKSVQTEHLVNVLKIGNEMKIRMILATRPE